MSYQYPFIPGHSSMPATPQATTYRWDDADPQHQHQHQQQQQDRLEQQVLQHPLQHQPEHHQDVYVPRATSTAVQVQEQVPTVPSQSTRRPGSSQGDEPRLRLQHVSVPAVIQPEHMRPPMIDTNLAYHVGTSASPPSGPPSAGPSTGALRRVVGPVRARISPVHVDPRAAAHPYRRPQSAAGVVIAKSRREFAAEDVQPSVRSRHPSASSSSMVMPAPPPMAQRNLAAFAKMTSTTKGLINPSYSATAGVSHQLVIRSDVHWDKETNVLTALCELPGRSRADVSVVLSTNPINRVKQVVVTAKSPQGPPVAEDGYVLRERRSAGNVSRTFVVPSDTTQEAVSAEMRDGLLTLTIQCPPPSTQDDSQEIVIR